MVIKFLRDPIWAALGVLVTIIALFLSFGDKDNHSEVSVIHYMNTKFDSYLLPSNRIKLIIEGIKENIENVEASYFILKNSSSKPLKPEDYLSPITVSKSVGVKRLVLVESCSEEITQSCSKNSSDGGAYVPLVWEKQEQRWQMKPELLNPGESSCVVLIWERESSSANKSKNKFSWSARIVGFSLNIYPSVYDYYNKKEKNASDIVWNIYIKLKGEGVYWFFALFSTLFSFLYYVALIAKWLTDRRIVVVVKTLVISIFSITTSSILVDIFVNHRSMESLHTFVAPLLISHFILAVFIFYKAVTRKNA